MIVWQNWKARRMLVVILTFCIISGSYSLPVYPEYAVPTPSYAPAVDAYPVPQLYVPSVDVYYQVPQPVPYPQVDPYAQPYPAVDPYAIPQPYPQVVLFPTNDPFSAAYPAPPQQQLLSVDPYAQLLNSYQAQPQLQYSPADPYAQLLNSYPVSPPAQQYPPVDVYPAPPPPPQQQQQQQPYQSLDQYSLSVPQNYPVAPIYQQPPPTIATQEQDNYVAVTFHAHFEYHKHCGVLAATNDDIYSSDPSPGGVNDVVPFGAFPWLEIIVDSDDSSAVCLGTIIHSNFILTAASCINKPAGKYSVYHDWDILTIYNEYEAYKSYAEPVCKYWRLGLDNSTGQTQYILGGPDAELVLIKRGNVAAINHHSEYPSDKILCLPSKSNGLPSPYGYQPQIPNPYAPSPYLPYPQIDYSNSYIPTGECWVAGYINSPTAVLQNHPPATPTSGQQQQQSADQPYYNNLDNSKVPRKALVRQIQCPVDHPYPGADDVCFVGVNGYDACVADRGTSVFCIIEDKSEYDSGVYSDRTSDSNVLPEGIFPSNPVPPQQPYQQQPLQVAPAPQKPPRRRAVLYAVVKATASCLPPYPPGYPPNVQQQSKYIVGSRVSPSIRGAIQDLFWQIASDATCPAEKRSGDLLPNSQEEQSLVSNSLASSLLQPQQYDPSILALSYAQPTYLYAPQNIITG